MLVFKAFMLISSLFNSPFGPIINSIKYNARFVFKQNYWNFDLHITVCPFHTIVCVYSVWMEIFNWCHWFTNLLSEHMSRSAECNCFVNTFEIVSTCETQVLYSFTLSSWQRALKKRPSTYQCWPSDIFVDVRICFNGWWYLPILLDNSIVDLSSTSWDINHVFPCKIFVRKYL